MSPTPAEPETAVVRLRLRRDLLRGLLLGLPWILAALGLAVELAAHHLREPDLYGLERLFSLSQEDNIPTLYQGLVLVASGAMLWAIARVEKQRGDRWHKHWWWLGAAFLYVGFDEWVSIHELTNQFVDLPGVFYFGWIIPYGIVAAICGALFLPFLRARPPAVRLLFVVAGVIYLSGALGMELPLGWWTARHGIENLGYSLIDWLEESLEMLGAGLFAATVLDIFRHTVSTVRLDLTEAPGTARADKR